MSTELFPAGPESEPTALPPWVTVLQCLVAECSGCNVPLGDEEEGVTYHFATIDEVNEEILGQGWTPGASGPLCTECQDSAEVTL